MLFIFSTFTSAFANDLQLQKRSNTNTTEMNGLNLKRRVTKINHVVWCFFSSIRLLQIQRKLTTWKRRFYKKRSMSFVVSFALFSIDCCCKRRIKPETILICCFFVRISATVNCRQRRLQLDWKCQYLHQRDDAKSNILYFSNRCSTKRDETCSTNKKQQRRCF